MKDTNILKKNTYKNDKIYNKDIDVQYKNEYIYIAIPFPPLSKNPADHIPENPVEKLLEAIDPKTTTNTTVTTNTNTPIKEKIVTYLKKESTKEKINGNVSSLKKNIGPLMEKISQNATMKNIVEKLMSTINSKEDFTLNMNAFFLAANEKNKRNIKEISGKETTFNHLNNNINIDFEFIPTIEIFYPDASEIEHNIVALDSNSNSDSLPKIHLQNIIDFSKGRVNHHSTWKMRNLLAIPFTSLLAVLPGPNVFVYWNMYRFYCHYRCQQGSEEIVNQLETELMKIDKREGGETSNAFVVKYKACKDLNSILLHIDDKLEGKEDYGKEEKALSSYGTEKLGIENLLQLYHRWK